MDSDKISVVIVSIRITVMIGVKVAYLSCLLFGASALPAKLPSSGYEFPVPKTPESLYETPSNLYEAPTPQVPDTLYQAPAQAPVHQPPIFVPAPQPSYEVPQPSYSAPIPMKGMPFDFTYEVQDSYNGIDFGHDSDSNGKVVEGEYHVALPDGRTQIVSYTADTVNGYQADVRYEGEATYPEPQPYRPEPSYVAPVQAYEVPAPAPAQVQEYIAPVQSYEAPAPSPVYTSPLQTYEPPTSLYETPSQSYETPSSLYESPAY